MRVVAVATSAEEIEPWELHSELVFVSPEVCSRALELMPERDPDAFLARPREPIVLATAPPEESDAPALLADALRYALRRLGHSARFALAVTLGSVGLALLAELLR
jgi:hypothetical protein